MTQKKYTDGNGVSEIWLNIKNWVTSQLLGYSQTGHTHSASDITSGLSTVATSGSYNDLSNKPTIPSNNNQLTNGAGYITSSGSCNYANSAGSSSIAIRDSGGSWISGRDNAVVKQTRHSTNDGNSWNPAVSVKTKSGNWTIGTVGYDKLQFSYDTDENYNTGNNRNIVVDLNPESGTIITSANIGSQSVNYANSAGSVAWGNVSGRPSLATVATSGSYNDLSNKPTIPTVNNATLTIQKNSSNVATFTANASSNVTANISVPTKVSELTNDSGFITSSGSCNYANSAGSVAWDNVTDKPSFSSSSNPVQIGHTTQKTGTWTLTGVVPYKPVIFYFSIWNSARSITLPNNNAAWVVGTTSIVPSDDNNTTILWEYLGGGDNNVKESALIIPLSSTVSISIDIKRSKGVNLYAYQ